MLRRRLWTALAVLIVTLNARQIQGSDRVTDIVSRLQGTDRIVAIGALFEIGRHDWTVTEAMTFRDILVTSLDGRLNRSGLAFAITHLAQQHPEEMRPALQALVQRLDLRYIATRSTSQLDIHSIASAFGQLKSKGELAVPALQAIVQMDERLPYGSVWAASALARIRKEGEENIDWLVARLDTERRHVVLAALGEVGPGAKKIIPKIQNLMDDRSGATRVLAARAYRQIQGEVTAKLLDILCTAVGEEPEEFALIPFGPSPTGTEHASYAAMTLRNMGKLAEPIRARLEQIERNGTESQKRLAAIALAGIRADNGME